MFFIYKNLSSFYSEFKEKWTLQKDFQHKSRRGVNKNSIGQPKVLIVLKQIKSFIAHFFKKRVFTIPGLVGKATNQLCAAFHRVCDQGAGHWEEFYNLGFPRNVPMRSILRMGHLEDFFDFVLPTRCPYGTLRRAF